MADIVYQYRVRGLNNGNWTDWGKCEESFFNEIKEKPTVSGLEFMGRKLGVLETVGGYQEKFTIMLDTPAKPTPVRPSPSKAPPQITHPNHHNVLEVVKVIIRSIMEHDMTDPEVMPTDYLAFDLEMGEEDRCRLRNSLRSSYADLGAHPDRWVTVNDAVLGILEGCNGVYEGALNNTHTARDANYLPTLWFVIGMVSTFDCVDRNDELSSSTHIRSKFGFTDVNMQTMSHSIADHYAVLAPEVEYTSWCTIHDIVAYIIDACEGRLRENDSIDDKGDPDGDDDLPRDADDVVDEDEDDEEDGFVLDAAEQNVQRALNIDRDLIEIARTCMPFDGLSPAELSEAVFWKVAEHIKAVAEEYASKVMLERAPSIGILSNLDHLYPGQYDEQLVQRLNDAFSIKLDHTTQDWELVSDVVADVLRQIALNRFAVQVASEVASQYADKVAVSDAQQAFDHIRGYILRNESGGESLSYTDHLQCDCNFYHHSRMNLAYSLDRRFGLNIPLKDAEDWTTVADVVKTVVKLLRAKEQAEAEAAGRDHVVDVTHRVMDALINVDPFTGTVTETTSLCDTYGWGSVDMEMAWQELSGVFGIDIPLAAVANWVTPQDMVNSVLAAQQAT
ncbi:peptidase [Burkholderia phage BcepSauron]|uniref:Peptidase n=1 Tax=Burkholderia phage BcepSauron TaxID=2530033 RepID=A0A482MM34_9CAUD|nr:peptidase [Burkholderia phage BcepSauron]QBQ74804.1 peptidase [Burkholderia phage BcepSauron]